MLRNARLFSLFSSTATRITRNTRQPTSCQFSSVQSDELKEYYVTPDLERKIYMAVDANGFGDQIEGLSNKQFPTKFNKALSLLAIKPDSVGFNAYDGYIVTMNANEKNKIEEIAGKKITETFFSKANLS